MSSPRKRGPITPVRPYLECRGYGSRPSLRSAGTTPACVAAPAHRRFECQTARLRCASARQAKRQRPCSWRRGVRRISSRLAPGLLLAPAPGAGGVDPRQDAEGTERRVAPIVAAPRKQVYAVCATHSRFEARAPLAKSARPAALHRGFSVPGAVASGRGAGGAAFGSPYPGGFRRPSFPPRPAIEGSRSSCRRTAGRGLPGAGITFIPARGRRLPPRSP